MLMSVNKHQSVLHLIAETMVEAIKDRVIVVIELRGNLARYVASSLLPTRSAQLCPGGPLGISLARTSAGLAHYVFGVVAIRFDMSLLFFIIEIL